MMDVKQIFQTSIKNLCANKARFLHAMLGMVIGVAGVVFILTMSNMLFNFGDVEDEEYVTGLINAYIYNHVDNAATSITAEDLERAVDANPEVLKAISPYVTFELSGGVRYEGNEPKYQLLLGVDEDYIDMIVPMQLKEGRFLEHIDMERSRKVCVIGSSIADELLGGEALGKTLKIWGENYTVVGVTSRVMRGMESEDYGVYIPYPNAQRMVGKTLRNQNTYYQDHYFIQATSEDTMYDAQLAIEEMCRQVTGYDKGYSVWSFAAYTFSGTAHQMNGIIYGMAFEYMVLAAIVLFIGGVGIMNVMLASVQARTKEIGIRKAFGATNQDIQRQFTMESIITSLIGGAFGIVVGLLATVLVSKAMGSLYLGGGVSYPTDIAYMSIPIVSILAAFGVSVLIGIVFGRYPANQAAKMEPVVAINSD